MVRSNKKLCWSTRNRKNLFWGTRILSLYCRNHTKKKLWGNTHINKKLCWHMTTRNRKKNKIYMDRNMLSRIKNIEINSTFGEYFYFDEIPHSYSEGILITNKQIYKKTIKFTISYHFDSSDDCVMCPSIDDRSFIITKRGLILRDVVFWWNKYDDGYEPIHLSSLVSRVHFRSFKRPWRFYKE
jgi:hypothetical protein